MDGFVTGKATIDIIGEDKAELLQSMVKNRSMADHKRQWPAQLFLDYHYQNDPYVLEEGKVQKSYEEFDESFLNEPWVSLYLHAILSEENNHSKKSQNGNRSHPIVSSGFRKDLELARPTGTLSR